MKSYQWLGLGMFLFLFSCQPQNEKINISKAGILQFPFTETETEAITFIYHYNTLRSKLEWTAVKLEQSSGNKLEDALSALLQDFQKSGICKGLQLDALTKEISHSIIHLSGDPIFKSEQDQTIFWSAFDLTVNRYKKSKDDIRLALNNQKI